MALQRGVVGVRAGVLVMDGVVEEFRVRVVDPGMEEERRAWESLCSAVVRSDGEEGAPSLEGDVALCRLLAWRRERVVAAWHGRFLEPRLYTVEGVYPVDPVSPDVAATAFCRFLAPHFGSRGIEVLTTDSAAAAPVNAGLVAAGFVIHRQKLLVSRDLSDFTLGPGAGLQLRPLSEVGRERFIEIMSAASVGDPFEETRDSTTEGEFRTLVELAGERFDPDDWYVAVRGGEAIGVVLPQAYPESPDAGTLFYVGVLPAHRGAGLGRRLHALGLDALRRRGVATYYGSTDTRNRAMLKIFRRNGCAPVCTQRFYRLDRPPLPGARPSREKAWLRRVGPRIGKAGTAKLEAAVGGSRGAGSTGDWGDRIQIFSTDPAQGSRQGEPCAGDLEWLLLLVPRRAIRVRLHRSSWGS
jgi:RimJ/RimL family protein N-acetyltransferase